MAEESTSNASSDANATPPNTPGGPEDIAKLFSGDKTQDSNASAGNDTTPTEPVEEYVEGRMPKAFHREDGNHDIEGLKKSWFETRKSHDLLKARLKELEKSAADVPAWDAWAAEIDWKAVAEGAPNAYLVPEEGQENRAAMSLARRLHEQGIPTAKANAALANYYADLNAIMPEAKTAEDLRKAAVAYQGPNGQSVMDEVKTGLASRAAKRAWSKEEMTVLDSMLSNGPAVAVLHQLIRTSAGAAPPNSGGLDSAQIPNFQCRPHTALFEPA